MEKNNNFYRNIFDLYDNFPIIHYEKLIINLAPTGMVSNYDDCPNIPLTVDEIIEDVYKCYRVGASVAHLHARDSDGLPTFNPSVFEEIIKGVKEKCRDMVICVTTSGRIFQKFEQRAKVLNIDEELKPDLASLTLGSMNFPKSTSVNSPEVIQKLARKMIEKNIKPELEVFEVGMLNYAFYLSQKNFLREPHYFNLLLGSLGSMPARTVDMCHLVNSLPNESTRGGTGIGKFQLPINVLAILMGGHVRVGLEDNLYYDYEKKEFATNEKLVKRVVRVAKEIRRQIASPSETRKILNLHNESD
jgi:uncharacterized protein (DUF849 family)